MALRVRNTIGNILVVAGVLMLLFAILWWGFAIRRIVVFPKGFELSTTCEGTVTRLAGRHGMLAADPPEVKPFGFDRTLTSLDEKYHGDTAVVAEKTSGRGPAPFGLNFDGLNVYTMNRRSCENVPDPLSASRGHPTDRSGSWYVNFPFGSKDRSRNIFDNSTGSAFSATSTKKVEVNGVGANRFAGSHGFRPVLEHMARSMGLPDSTTFGELKAELAAAGLDVDAMVRSASGSLTAQEKEAFAAFPDSRPISLTYSAKVEWEADVEPVTGTILRVNRGVTRLYVNTDTATFLPLFEILAAHSEDPLVSRYLSQADQQKLLEPKEVYRVEYRWGARGVKEATDYAGGRISRMRFVKDWLMTTFLLLGAIFFVAGFVIRVKEHRAGGAAHGHGERAGGAAHGHGERAPDDEGKG